MCIQIVVIPEHCERLYHRANGRYRPPGSVAKQAFRKQQLRTWKLQQREQEVSRRQEEEVSRRQEEEDRRKREDEIRRIRDLSNQDEQYNRFMKLVGGRPSTRSRVGTPQKKSEAHCTFWWTTTEEE